MTVVSENRSARLPGEGAWLSRSRRLADSNCCINPLTLAQPCGSALERPEHRDFVTRPVPSIGGVTAPPPGLVIRSWRFVIRLFAATFAAVAAALFTADTTAAASVSTLHQREHRQRLSLHARLGTVRFFHHHPSLARTSRGRRALRVAHVWIPIIRRELAETRAALRPGFAVPAWWLPGALCVHSKESGDWHISNPPYANGMQFVLSTWLSVGGSVSGWRWSSPQEQLYRSYLLWKLQGWAPWPNTSRACGLR